MKKLIFTLPLIFAAMTANGQNSDKFTGTLLWKVSGNGLTAPSYLFGINRLASVDFAKNYPGFNEAFESATQLVGDILLSETQNAQNAMAIYAAMPEGTTYRSLLSEDEYDTLDQTLKNLLGTGLDQLGQMKPAMITHMISRLTTTNAMPELDPQTHISIDQYIQQQADQKGMKTIGLETAEDQLRAVFCADPLDKQAKDLICSLTNLEHSEESTRKINKLYAEGKLFEAYAAIFDDPDTPCPMSDQSAAAINKNRNDKWIERLPGIFADGPTFVAVGMIHLCGQEGILYQLDRLGYSVEPVR